MTVTMFILHLQLAVDLCKTKCFFVSIKDENCFALLSSTCMYLFFQENINANLMFEVCCKCDCKSFIFIFSKDNPPIPKRNSLSLSKGQLAKMG